MVSSFHLLVLFVVLLSDLFLYLISPSEDLIATMKFTLVPSSLPSSTSRRRFFVCASLLEMALSLLLLSAHAQTTPTATTPATSSTSSSPSNPDLSNLNFNIPVAAGMDFVGWGVDIRQRNPRSGLIDDFLALRPQMFDFTWIDPNGTINTYLYPYGPNGQPQELAIPNEVVARTVGKTVVESFAFRNSEELRVNFDLTIGVRVMGTLGSGAYVDGKFAGGLRFIYVDETDKRIFVNVIQTDLYQLYLKRRNAKLKPDVLEALENIRGSKNAKDYENFLNLYV